MLTNIVRAHISYCYACALRAPNASVLIWVPGWPAEFILNIEETGYRSLKMSALGGSTGHYSTALSGQTNARPKCLSSGVKRTSACALHMSAIGTKRTYRIVLHMSAFGDKAEHSAAFYVCFPRYNTLAILDAIRRDVAPIRLLLPPDLRVPNLHNH